MDHLQQINFYYHILNKVKFSLNLVFIFVSITSLKVQAQSSSFLYADIATYRNTSFKINGFASGEIGIGFLNDLWVSPQVGVQYGFGNLDDRERFQTTNDITFKEAFLDTRFESFSYSFGLQFSLEKKRDRDLWWLFLPKVLTGSTKATSSYFVLNNDQDQFEQRERNSSKKKLIYFSLSVGIEGNLSQNEKLSFAFLISYTTKNLENLFIDVQPRTTNLTNPQVTTQSIGLRLLIKYNPFSQKNN